MVERRRVLAELDESKLDEPSLALLAELGDHPVRRCSKLGMEPLPDGRWSLVVAVPSPTGDRRRAVSMWLDEKRIPTLQFGGWRTHASLWDGDIKLCLQRMLYYLERITDGEIVLQETPTADDGLPARVLDPGGHVDGLGVSGSPAGSTNARLLSWSGAEDRATSDLVGARDRRDSDPSE